MTQTFIYDQKSLCYFLKTLFILLCYHLKVAPATQPRALSIVPMIKKMSVEDEPKEVCVWCFVGEVTWPLENKYNRID